MAQQGRVITDFARTYNSMSGSDIKAVFNGRVFAELQAISYAVTREKAPIYTMGSADPRSYSRNKRGIAGSMVWINFDRHSFLDHFKNANFVADIDEIRPEWIEDNPELTSLNTTVTTYGVGGDELGLEGVTESELATAVSDQMPAVAWYSDQVPPFDVVLVANNEYGGSSKMKLVGLEILNDGTGVSVDDNVIESQATFVARTVLAWKAVKSPFKGIPGSN